MDSTYLCRGKRLDNEEWIVGWRVNHDLIRDHKSGSLLRTTNMSTDGRFECDVVRVDPTTIGRCTGLPAAKSYRGDSPEDKLVFEGDVCDFVYCNNRYRGKIVYNPRTCALEMWNNIVVGAYGEKATNTRLLCHCEKIEIVGTIHDIPKEATNES